MTDVAAAWRGSREFLQLEIEGLGTEPDGHQRPFHGQVDNTTPLNAPLPF
ncbi:hypothetical protein ONA91_38610 [Micromonospora sp. DR5-3]|nr:MULTISPECIES: hypothetical protein [unclassified Micromonospora]MCW3820360.1 hypothetical protein [Micromonospora sp. DR5-3]